MTHNTKGQSLKTKDWEIPLCDLVVKTKNHKAPTRIQYIQSAIANNEIIYSPACSG